MSSCNCAIVLSLQSTHLQEQNKASASKIGFMVDNKGGHLLSSHRHWACLMEHGHLCTVCHANWLAHDFHQGYARDMFNTTLCQGNGVYQNLTIKEYGV